jgi:hypothetical protein
MAVNVILILLIAGWCVCVFVFVCFDIYFYSARARNASSSIQRQSVVDSHSPPQQTRTSQVESVQPTQSLASSENASVSSENASKSIENTSASSVDSSSIVSASAVVASTRVMTALTARPSLIPLNGLASLLRPLFFSTVGETVVRVLCNTVVYSRTGKIVFSLSHFMSNGHQDRDCF